VTAHRLLFALLLISTPLYAKEKIKIQIVESTTLAQKSNSGQEVRVLLSFHLKAVLPDGSHAELLCMGGESKCYGIVPNMPPEKVDPKSEQCTVSEDGLTTTDLTGLI
jgi:hypothetical protein